MFTYLFLFLNELFPAINNILGIEYSSNLNRGLIVITTSGILIQVAKKIYKSRVIKMPFIIVIFLLLGYAVLIFSTFTIRGPISSIAEVHFLNYLIRIIPTFLLVPLLLGKSEEWHKKNLKVIYYFLGISIGKFIIDQVNGDFVYISLNFGGVNYNDFGYICAINVILGSIIFQTTRKFKTKFSFTLFVAVLITSVIGLILSSSRGAILSCILVIGITLVMKENRLMISFDKILKLLVLSVLVGLLIYSIRDNELINKGLTRAFSFLNFGGGSGIIDWSQTSDRQPIYLESLNIFKQMPFLGHGMGAFLVTHRSATFSHNIFLDILIDGGIVYFLLWIIFLLIIFFVGIKNQGSFFNDYGFKLFLLLFLKLLSGSTFLVETLFWLGIFLVLMNEYKRKQFLEKSN